MKQLKTSRLNCVIVYNNLKRNAMSKDYGLDVTQITSVGQQILPAFAKHIGDFIEENKKIEEARRARTLGKINDQDLAEKLAQVNKKVLGIEAKARETKVAVEMEDADFNVFFDIAEKKSKEWFADVEDFVSFRKDYTKANTITK